VLKWDRETEPSSQPISFWPCTSCVQQSHHSLNTWPTGL